MTVPRTTELPSPDGPTTARGLLVRGRFGRRREAWRAHLPLALTAGIFLGAIRLWPASWNWFSVCLWSRWTGLPCPFCGLTRSLGALAHGDWGGGLAQAPLSGVLLAAALLTLIWHGTGLMLGRRLTVGPRLQGVVSGLPGVLIFLILANWIYRLTLGLN